MARIRKANFLDKFKIRKMISFLSNDVINYYTKGITNFPLNIFHDILPLKLKFLPETYIIEENKIILGMVTVLPTPGNPCKLGFSRLYLEQDYYNAGKQLLTFVISKYGAKGATSFIASIADSYDELLHLFFDGCGFRQCSSEQMWKFEEQNFEDTEKNFIRPFKIQDAKNVADVFNDSVITHFKYSISKTKKEILSFENFEKKFIIEDENTKSIKAYFSITSSDKKNYTLDIISSPWYECSWDNIIKFSRKQIEAISKEDFNLYIKLKKYTIPSESLENYLIKKNASCVQNKLILVKDFYKIIKEPEQAHRILLFNDIEKPVYKI